ncbi:hypothetical protein PHET_09677 [Paragonimus heterotremus]|uniref:Uncharacterized protein n=1 Tax=Paragonimus heterotremus TaxID=100268 RepID=A0A8J4WEM1_9TREM|nr:hypothetical protein PHET_09677 [Paragonimus heterotremus]
MKIAKVEVSSENTVHTFIFYVRSNNGKHLPSPYVVRTLSRLDRQQLAIILGVPVVRGPGVYDLEANQPVDDRLWIIGVAFAILIVALILGWLIIFVYYNVCLASVMHLWIRSPTKDPYENQSLRGETSRSTDNGKKHVRLEKAATLQYVESQSFSIERNLEGGQNRSTASPPAITVSESNRLAAIVPIKLKAAQLKRKKSHLAKAGSSGRAWKGKGKRKDDLVNKCSTLKSSDSVTATRASDVAAAHGTVNESFADDQDERMPSETKPDEPELLQPTPFGSECLSYMRPIIISRGVRPEAVEMLGLTYSITLDEVRPTV